MNYLFFSIFNLFFCFYDSVAHADPGNFASYKVNGKPIQLVHVAESHLLISPSCLVKTENGWKENANCEAIQKLKLVSLKALSHQLIGGANPGSVACLKEGGQVFVALDAKANQNSVCKFKDGSIVSSGTLHYHARSNDLRSSN